MKLSNVVWETQKLGDLCDLITDGTHFTPKYVDVGIPFLSVKNLTNGKNLKNLKNWKNWEKRKNMINWKN